jgi:hypothetical protein
MQQLLFLPAYRSFYLSLTRTVAQPHRAHPPSIYEPTAHATEAFPTLSTKLAMERRPYMDDFLFSANIGDGALQLRDRVVVLLDRLGLGRNPKKGQWEPTQICDHLGLQIDTTTSTFRAPPSKLQAIATLSRTLRQRSTRDARWLPTRQLAVLAGKVQYLYLAIPAARFYLRELHDFLATRTIWGGRERLTYQLKRDL